MKKGRMSNGLYTNRNGYNTSNIVNRDNNIIGKTNKGRERKIKCQ